MIGAVGTSSVQSTPLRSLPQSGLPLPVQVSEVRSNPFFISSRLRVDNELDIAILEFRSSETGDVIRQYPTESQIRAFQHAAQITAERETEADASAKAARNAQVEQKALSSPSSGYHQQAGGAGYSAQASSSAPSPQTTIAPAASVASSSLAPPSPAPVAVSSGAAPAQGSAPVAGSSSPTQSVLV